MLNTVRHRFEIMGVPSFPGAQLLIFWGGVEAGFNGFSNNPVEYSGSVTCPTLFLHGADDPRARLAEARCVFEAIPGATKRLVAFPGCRHEAAIARFPEKWKAAVRSFLQDLAAKPAPVYSGLRSR